MRLTRKVLLLGGALVLALAALAMAFLRTVRADSTQLQANAADTLCALEATDAERLAAAREAAQGGTLKGALEREACPAAAFAVGLSQLAFVYERDCARDACLAVLLRDPSSPQALALAEAHAAKVVEGMAARSCDLGDAQPAKLLQELLGPSAPALVAANRGRLLAADREGVRSLLAKRDPRAARLLQAMLHGQPCQGDGRGDRRELAGALLLAMGIAVSDPVDVPAALEHVECGPLVELVAGLGLSEPPRLAEAAPWLSRCALLPRSLRARAAGYVELRAAPVHSVRPERGFRAVDQRSRRELALDGEALSPGLVLLDDRGLLRGLAFLEGEDGLVCGAPALRWTDERGRLRVLLDTSGVRFFDVSGRVRAWLGARRAELRSPSGEVVARAEAGADRGVQLEDSEGRVRARGVWRAEGTQLKLLDGDAMVASLIVDSHGAQLQLGGAVLEAIPDQAPCVSVGAPATARSRFALLGPLGARAALALESAALLLPPLDFSADQEAERLDANDTSALRLLRPGAHR